MDVKIDAILKASATSIFSPTPFRIVVAILGDNQSIISMYLILQHKSYQQVDATFPKEDN